MFLVFDFRVQWLLHIKYGLIDLYLDQDILDSAGQPLGESQDVAHAAAVCPIYLQAKAWRISNEKSTG
jgi:hypothetical protein